MLGVQKAEVSQKQCRTCNNAFNSIVPGRKSGRTLRYLSQADNRVEVSGCSCGLRVQLELQSIELSAVGKQSK